MKFCQPHWDMLRDKIEELGLTHLVATSGEAAMKRTMDELSAIIADRMPGKSTYDPLMAMHNLITARVMESVGPILLAERDEKTDDMPPNEGHFCPLCIVMRSFKQHLNAKDGKCPDLNDRCTLRVTEDTPPWDQEWVDSCGRYVLKEAAERGLKTN